MLSPDDRTNVVTLTTRGQFVSCAPAMLGGSASLSACSPGTDVEGYQAVAARTGRLGAINGFEGTALSKELVRVATLAASSHNTPCWKFAVVDNVITILPDLSRRTPAVDPDNFPRFGSLGCASENLVQSALAHGRTGARAHGHTGTRAHGLAAEAGFDAASDAVHVTLAPIRSQATALFKAVSQRQCTRRDYDAKPLSNEELRLLESAGTADGARVLVLTERSQVERVLDLVVQGNTAQMADAAFVKEVKAWIRFNGADAVRTGDGLCSVSSGNLSVPSWIGDLAFGLFFTPKSENDKYARQIRSCAGIAVFVGQAADQAHWAKLGRCCERFALQAAALGICNALLNQPLEVPSVRPLFAAALGLAGQRPDRVVRFGRGPALPQSLRRPVQAVLV